MPDRDEALEGLLEDTERELARAGGAGPDTAGLAREEALQELNALEKDAATPVDAALDLRVSEDNMEARASFVPPGAGGQPLELGAVEEALRSRRIISGIDWERIKYSVLRCNTEQVAVSDVLVALGKRPRDEIGAHLILEPNLLEKKPPPQTDQRVDWRAISPFVFVKKGDVLARVALKQAGEMGCDVFGVALAFGKKPVKFPKPGRNVVRDGGTVVSAIDGRFTSNADSFSVSEVLEIAGDVDLSTGNIEFNGEVAVGGNIGQGFAVKTGGALFCRGLINAADIVCGGDLITERGILGRGAGRVVAKGNVRAKFVENCHLEAIGRVEVQSGILNSLVYSLDTVSVVPKGVIAGGRVVASNGVEARQIGSASGTRTEIHCGIDHTIARQLAWTRDRTIALAFKLAETQSRLSRRGADEPRVAAMHERLTRALRQLNDRTRSLLGALDRNENAAVRVLETVYPGTYIEICNVSFVVIREMHHVRFVLDKVHGKIAARAL